MNLNRKTRIANIFTAIVSILVSFQALLTHPPFSETFVSIAGGIITYSVLVFTTWKQYLSPEINSNGANVTIWIAFIATIAGIVDLLDIFNITIETKVYIKLSISTLTLIINVLSKQIFPSLLQSKKMEELKKTL